MNPFLWSLNVPNPTLREEIILQDLKLMLGSVRPDKLAEQSWERKWGWDDSVKDMNFAESSCNGLKSQYSLQLNPLSVAVRQWPFV